MARDDPPGEVSVARRQSEPGGFGPIWFVGGEARKQVGDVIEEVRQAPMRGLDPADYDLEYLNTAWTNLQSGKALSPRDLALFDAGLTITLLRTISDLHIGRITPRRAGVSIDPST